MVCEDRSSVRRAILPDDAPEIFRLYTAGLDELGQAWDQRLVLNKIVNSYHLAPCFLLVIDDKICGMAGFTVVSSSHSGDASLADYMFYVEPEHRNMESLNALTGSVKAFASEHKLPVRLEFIVTDDEAAKRRLLSMHGFKVGALIGVLNG
jgi:hypothetical protein